MLARLLQFRSDRAVRLTPGRSPRRALAVGVIAFVAATLGSGWALERSDAIRDPVFGRKEQRLRAAARSDGPLILVLGSSRVENGVHATYAEAALRRTGHRATVFNFGTSGAGPLTMSVYLRRLLANGTIPDRIVIEVLPKLLTDTAAGPPELAWLNPERFSHRERAELIRLSPAGTEHWPASGGMPWREYGNQILFRLAPSQVTPSVAFAWTHPSDERGWSRFFVERPTPDQRTLWTQRAERECRPNLAAFQPHGVAAESFRQMIQTCRERAIPVHLLLMPEGTVFHGWYGPGVNDELKAYLASLPASVTDARPWMPDDAFADAHHLLPGGAAAFTDRLATEVLRPLLERRSP